MAAWLAAALGVTLVVSRVLGHAELGAAVALGFVLTAVPSLPLRPRAAVEIFVVRGADGSRRRIAGGADCLELRCCMAPPSVAAAVFGALVEKVGPTAGLAVVLIAVDTGSDGGTSGRMRLGALAVLAAWLVWFGRARGRNRTPARSATTVHLPRRLHGARTARRPGRRRRSARPS